jgi:hypothetical protein
MKLIIGAYLRELKTIPVTINIIRLALWSMGRPPFVQITDYVKFCSSFRADTKYKISVTWGKPAAQT